MTEHIHPQSTNIPAHSSDKSKNVLIGNATVLALDFLFEIWSKFEWLDTHTHSLVNALEQVSTEWTSLQIYRADFHSGQF